MSAAATAAGYLYASGRLRGRGAREQQEEQREPREHQQEPQPPRRAQNPPKERIRVAVYPQEEKPRRTPKVEYRTRRRWTPE